MSNLERRAKEGRFKSCVDPYITFIYIFFFGGVGGEIDRACSLSKTCRLPRTRSQRTISHTGYITFYLFFAGLNVLFERFLHRRTQTSCSDSRPVSMKSWLPPDMRGGGALAVLPLLFVLRRGHHVSIKMMSIERNAF